MNLFTMIFATIGAVLLGVLGALLFLAAALSPVIAIWVGSQFGLGAGLLTLGVGGPVGLIVSCIMVALSTDLFDVAEDMKRILRAGYHTDTPWRPM